MLGKQEGALRELLRQFREGDVDRALSHAFPLGGEGGRGGTPSVDGKLPTVDPTYSLQSLLGSNRGPTGLWFGGFDVQSELAKEYRKAAEEAERRADYRRAAYIHGRLLNDFATAAQLLSTAGLHRDAAYLYLRRLKDLEAAARSFEAAGEVDRALELYRQDRRHAEAGDLLGRLGEGGRRARWNIRSPPSCCSWTPRAGRSTPGTCSATGPGGPTWPWGTMPRGGRVAPRTTPSPAPSGWPRSSPTSATSGR